jgi:3'-phosphoadenosine 5'-phosphosulfate sulfotransferase (PAPS reductase)/FAD synthetase
MLKVVVPVSGGKDSQACLKLAVEHYKADEILGLFCDTQFEHPLTYAHLDRMRSLYGVKIEILRAGSVPEKIRKYQRFPSFGSRFCTEELKIWPSKKAYTLLAEIKGHGFEVWYGVRQAESAAREKRYAGKVGDDLYAPHEFMPGKYPKYLAKLGVMFRVPVVEWSTQDVKDFVGPENLNPLYKTFDRVGCFPCLAAGDGYKQDAFRHDAFGERQHQTVIVLEKEIGKSVWTSKAAKDRYADCGCAICAM